MLRDGHVLCAAGHVCSAKQLSVSGTAVSTTNLESTTAMLQGAEARVCLGCSHNAPASADISPCPLQACDISRGTRPHYLALDCCRVASPYTCMQPQLSAAGLVA